MNPCFPGTFIHPYLLATHRSDHCIPSCAPSSPTSPTERSSDTSSDNDSSYNGTHSDEWMDTTVSILYQQTLKALYLVQNSKVRKQLKQLCTNILVPHFNYFLFMAYNYRMALILYD